MTKMIVEMRGGEIVAYHSTDPIQMVIVNWDDNEVCLYMPDNVGDDLISLFNQPTEEEIKRKIKMLFDDRAGI
jgi:hypothetical protein